MGKFIHITELKENLDIDFQLLSEEMSVNANKWMVLSDSFNLDCVENHAFNKLFNDIRDNGDCESSYDDATDNFLFERMNLVLHTTLENKYIIAERHDSVKIENMLASYR